MVVRGRGVLLLLEQLIELSLLVRRALQHERGVGNRHRRGNRTLVVIGLCLGMDVALQCHPAAVVNGSGDAVPLSRQVQRMDQSQGNQISNHPPGREFGLFRSHISRVSDANLWR